MKFAQVTTLIYGLFAFCMVVYYFFEQIKKSRGTQCTKDEGIWRMLDIISTFSLMVFGVLTIVGTVVGFILSYNYNVVLFTFGVLSILTGFFGLILKPEKKED